MLEVHRTHYEPGATRICKICHFPRPIENFRWKVDNPRPSSASRKTHYFRINTCEECISKKKSINYKRWRRNNRSKSNLIKVKWQKAHPEYVAMAQRKSYLKKYYGLTQEDYLGMVERQQGLCAICRQPSTKGILQIDHCHKTGRVRGLLCDPCNKAIGLMKDSPEYLKTAASYSHLVDIVVDSVDVPGSIRFIIEQEEEIFRPCFGLYGIHGNGDRTFVHRA
jgi:Recombination endonuclease VII